jgi:heme/copper-type cytochrome/quinol oxidase subunit 2
MKTKLKEVKEDFYAFSGATSSIYRQLALAGIAIIWLFKKEKDGQIQITADLLCILKLIVISLIFDFCHGVFPTIVYGIMNIRFRNKGKDDEDEVNYSQAWTIPEWMFFALKIVFLVWAFISLWVYLSNAIRTA